MRGPLRPYNVPLPSANHVSVFFSTNAVSTAVGPNQSPLQLTFQLVAPKGTKADIICSEMARREKNNVANLATVSTSFRARRCVRTEERLPRMPEGQL